MTVAPELSAKPLERRSKLTYHMLSPPVLRRACMHRHSHPLPAPSLGVQRDVVSLHFGVPGAGPKVYLQAGLRRRTAGHAGAAPSGASAGGRASG